MAITIGNAGEGALKRGAVFVAAGVLLATLLVAILSAGLGQALGGSSALASLFWIALFSAEMYYFRRDLADLGSMLREGRHWLVGAEGERRVDAVLKTLPDDYIVFHDFHPLAPDGAQAAWNVDHIVVGPTGVFVLETKNYSARNVGSADKDFRTRKNVKQAKRNAWEFKQRVEKWSGGALHDLFVVPVVVYANENTHVEELREGAVRVLPLRMLATDITRHHESAIDMDRAKRLARVLYHQIPVQDRTQFEDALVGYGRRVWAEASEARVPPKTAPVASPGGVANEPLACPKCGAPMRLIKRGPYDDFWGCSRFRESGCRGKRDLAGRAK
jgi:hypothetical protein